MKIRIRGFGFAGVLVAILGSSSIAAAGPAPKVDICHWDATSQTFSVINVSANAVSAHFRNHGDSTPASYWSDADGDGFGNEGGTFNVCPQLGLVGNADDCNDGNALVNPGETEAIYNGVDDDCNAATLDDDLDSDGYGHATDCDERNGDVNPGEAETPYNGVDDDCNASTLDDDLDQDGFGIASDCDDVVSTTFPGAEDVCDDGVDNNCDSAIDENCRDACPCFGTADIQGAYDAYLAKAREFESNYAQCDRYDYPDSYYGAFHQTHLYFVNQTYDYPQTYAYDVNRFYSYGWDEYYLGHYCSINSYHYVHNYQTGEYEYEQVNKHQQITHEESAACEEIVIDWAADAGMACYVY